MLVAVGGGVDNILWAFEARVFNLEVFKFEIPPIMYLYSHFDYIICPIFELLMLSRPVLLR